MESQSSNSSNPANSQNGVQLPAQTDNQDGVNFGLHVSTALASILRFTQDEDFKEQAFRLLGVTFSREAQQKMQTVLDKMIADLHANAADEQEDSQP
jgi:hypothetical protein